MTKAIKYDDARLLKSTGKTWKQWMVVFKKMKAKDLEHKEIAALLEKGYEVSGWWAQSLTVQFEQEAGKRIPGERSDGSFYVTVSSIKDGDVDEVFEKWKLKFASYGVASVSITPKWRYWKIKLADKTKINVNFSKKSENKTLVQVSHENLPDAAQIEKSRARWKKELAAF